MPPLELAVVLPTFNERQNVRPVLDRLEKTLRDVAYEVIFVDDNSPDGTADEVRSIALSNSRVRVIQRIGRRGLASACVEGMMASPAPYIAIMDADLQHDETVLPQMLQLLKSKDLDLVIGTRNSLGGSMGSFSASRVWLSNLGRRLSTLVTHQELSDPMSGFFMLSRPFLQETVGDFSAVGFKILLDIVASSRRPVRIAEVPYRFGEREFGESKLDILVGLEYLYLVLDKLLGDYMPVRFVLFAMVGGLGVLVHLALLYELLHIAGLTFGVAQLVATVVVMTFNFLLNNWLTYRDRRLRGASIVLGLATYYAACSIGAFVNVRVGTFVVENGWPWYAGGILGVVLGSVWNYAVTAVFTWKGDGRRRRAPKPVSQ